CVIYASCEPCPMCLAAIYWAKISTLYFANTKEDAAAIGFDDQFIYEEIALDPVARKLPVTTLLRDEAQEAFSLWKISGDKIDY
ncbi:MAG: nucleoside deaminase, partial [Mucilaginibacter polytrichastri]|nr:nucleoside deaminase [Mucilaginibacter polytrichastri]